MATEWWIYPAVPTMRYFDVPCGTQHCHVETRRDDFCRRICFLHNQQGFPTMSWYYFPHSRFHQEWPDCQHRGSQWPPTQLQKRFDFYWQCVEIQACISSRLFSIPSPSRQNMQDWTLIHRRKVSRTSCLVLSGQWRVLRWRVLVHHRRRRSRFSRLMSVFVLQHAYRLSDHGAFSGQFIWKLGAQGA